MRKCNLLVAVILALMSATSCVTPKKVFYLQDMNDTTQIELENRFEAVISPYDELDIWVSCSDKELAEPFNIMSRERDYSGSYARRGYLVDVNGDIEFPVIGRIHVAGMTRLQLQEYIKKVLVDGEYMSKSNPFVNVRFNNYKIFFLSPEGGSSISISNERCTFLEALALHGGINSYTRRDKIGVLRNVDGKMVLHYMDPRSSEIFNDPFFLLQQNDFIITESIKSRYYMNEVNYWMSWMGVLSSITSVVTMIVVLLK
ncbi:MAG: polysaccharide biosynthesis/export family protein [bacterium]|nr:polysaccharide biosynthesis/export family protein [Candidatus Limimorpha caballi]